MNPSVTGRHEKDDPPIFRYGFGTGSDDDWGETDTDG